MKPFILTTLGILFAALIGLAVSVAAALAERDWKRHKRGRVWPFGRN